MEVPTMNQATSPPPGNGSSFCSAPTTSLANSWVRTRAQLHGANAARVRWEREGGGGTLMRWSVRAFHSWALRLTERHNLVGPQVNMPTVLPGCVSAIRARMLGHDGRPNSVTTCAAAIPVRRRGLRWWQLTPGRGLALLNSPVACMLCAGI